MQILPVVLSDECQHPLPRQFDVPESIRQVAWRVVAGAHSKRVRPATRTRTHA